MHGSLLATILQQHTAWQKVTGKSPSMLPNFPPSPLPGPFPQRRFTESQELAKTWNTWEKSTISEPAHSHPGNTPQHSLSRGAPSTTLCVETDTASPTELGLRQACLGFSARLVQGTRDPGSLGLQHQPQGHCEGQTRYCTARWFVNSTLLNPMSSMCFSPSFTH